MKRLHRLLACLPVALIVFTMCLTGAILVFRSELEHLVYPHLYYVQEQDGGRLPLAELIPRIQAPSDTAVLSSLTITPSPDESYLVTFSGQGRSAFFIDPYTGELLGKSPQFFNKVMQLHRWLLLPNVSIGRRITHYATILFIALIITGLFLIIRMHRRHPSRLFVLNLRKGRHRFLFDLHAIGGIYATLVLLLLSVTALTFGGSHHHAPRTAAAPLSAATPARHASPVSMTVSKPLATGVPVAAPSPMQAHTHEQSAAPQHDNSHRPRHDGAGDTLHRRPRRPDAVGDSTAPHPRRNGDSRPPHRDGNSRPPHTEGDSLSAPVRHGGRLSSRSTETTSPEIPSAHRGGEGSRGREQQKPEPPAYAHWDDVLRTIQAEQPNYRSISFRNNTVQVAPRQIFGNIRASDSYTFDPATGEITERRPYAEQDRSMKMRGWLYTLHVGAWGGLFSRILTCLACLIGAALVITGCHLSLRRYRHKSTSPAPPSSL